MDIGTGIAIAGIWTFAGMTAHSKWISGFGTVLAMAVAAVATVTVILI